MVLLENDPFLNELNRMYERQKKQGTVWVTMKRSAMRPRKTKKEQPKEEEYVCLMRASDGKKHVSTTVNASQYVKFSQAVAVIMKAHMDALKKKEKVKSKEKSKA